MTRDDDRAAGIRDARRAVEVDAIVEDLDALADRRRRVFHRLRRFDSAVNIQPPAVSAVRPVSALPNAPAGRSNAGAPRPAERPPKRPALTAGGAPPLRQGAASRQ
jgi:hypothetical protein